MKVYSEDKALLASFKLSVFEDALAELSPRKSVERSTSAGYSNMNWVDVITDYAAAIHFGEEGDFSYYTDDQLFRLWQILYYLYISIDKGLDPEKCYS